MSGLDQSALLDLACAVAERRVILFVGAGVSMAVGLPSWRRLIEHMADDLDLDRRLIDEREVSYQALAEFYRIRQGSIGPLRSWMDREWKIAPERVAQSQVHQLIVSLKIPLIYTTNYDRNLEAAYEAQGEAYVKIANAKDVAKAEEGVTQIVKFHGDFDDDASLVLAETDYFDRLSFDSPLDVKFRADALGRTLLFIGYSMSDLNIRLLLHRLWQTWSRSGYAEARPGSFVFTTRPNPVQDAVLARWGITALSAEAASEDEALRDFLGRLAEAVEARRRA